MNNQVKKIALLGIMACCLLATASGQDLEQVGKAGGVSVNGGLSVNQIFYAIDGAEQRRDPYSYFLSGNLALNLYGWSIPVSFSLSNQNSSFQQPFNQYGIHPTYKWITAHLGWGSMNFSPYTLNGYLFLGAGIEAEPTEKWKVSGMYGRLQKAVERDTVRGTEAAFQRMGYAFKASYGTGADRLDLILFRAKDDASSITIPDGETNILPEENLVLSVGGSKMLFKKLRLSGEWATSAITRDIRVEGADAGEGIFDYAGALFTPRASSAYYNAYKTSLAYQGTHYTLGVGYERVDPGYRTLGAYFFNNDLENITANAAVVLLKGKLNLGVNTGVQRDNLDDTKISAMQRWVGSVNVTYAASEKLNINASYSSFQTFTNIRNQFDDLNQLTPFDNLDTLDFTQISQNANLNMVYMVGASKKKRQSVNLNLSFQDAADKQGDVEQDSGTRFYNINSAYSVAFTEAKTSLTAAFNYARNESGLMNSTTLGPTLAVNRSFLERKLRSTFSASWNNAYSNGDLLSTVVNIRLMSGYTIKKKHNVSLNLVGLSRSSETEQNASEFTEFTGTLGYSFNF